MATQLDPRALDVEEQLVRIRKAQQEIDQISAETRKMLAEAGKVGAEVKILPWSMIFQAMLATAALLGAGAAVAKLFSPD